jgi:cobalt-zinc-cadmium efflux system membrane fusion protein
MNAHQEHEESLHGQGTGDWDPNSSTSTSPSGAALPPFRMGFVQRLVVAILLSVVVVPPAAGFYSYFSGVPLHLLAASKQDKETEGSSDRPRVSLVPGLAHTLQVPEDVAVALGMRKGQKDSVAAAWVPTTMRPIVLPGSTALDPTRLDRIRARFAPARVVELGKVWDRSPGTGQSESRELRPGDHVSKGDLLGIFYSVDVGSKKNDLLDALVQLELDQRILDEAVRHAGAVPKVFVITSERAVQGDRNAVNRALNNLKAWDIPQEEIDALQAEAKKISADKNAWLKTPEGRWVMGEKQATQGRFDPNKQAENPWGRVTLRAEQDGVIVERNVHVGEMVVDNTVNLFQIADVVRLLVIANCPEEALPTLEALHGLERRWTVRTVGATNATGLPGTMDEVGYMIDPNQHTAVIKGYVENPGNQIRAGQYVTATVDIPPPGDVVEIPTSALVDDGLQSVVFVQPDPALPQYTMRRVQVTNRFERTLFVRDTPLPREKQLSAREAEEGLLPIEPLRPGERVVLAGAVELKAALLLLESRASAKQPTGPAAKPKAKSKSDSDIESAHAKKSETNKG